MPRRLAPVFLFALLAVVPLAAQPPGGLPPFPGPVVNKATLERAIALYLDPAVQADLKLTADQKAALGKLADDALARHKDALDKLEAERKEAAADRAKADAKVVADTEAALAKHLSAGQMARVRQLRFQMLGLTAFRLPEVAAAVKLTDEQEKALTAAGADISRAFDRAPVPGEAAPPRPAPTSRAEASRKAFERFVAGLTVDQQVEWKKLAGEPSPTVSSMTFFGVTATSTPVTLSQRLLLTQLDRNEALQTELRLTPEQVKGVGEVMTAMRPAFGRRDSFALMRTVTNEVTLGAARVLTAEQNARMVQLLRQLVGLGAFGQFEVLKAVKLTPEQANAVEEASREVMRKAGTRPGFPRDGTAPDADRFRQQLAEYTAKTAALDVAAMADVMAKLDDTQKRVWEGLVGPAFDPAKLGPAAGDRAVGMTGVAPDGSRVSLGLAVVPADVWAREARRLVAAGTPAEGVKAYDEAMKLKPDSAAYMTSKAWLLATCPDDRVRDGKQAVALAEKACGLTKSPSPAALGTLAAAYAEAGRFDEAVATQEKALAATKASGRATTFGPAANRPAGDEARLKLYRDKKPFREARD